MADDGQYYGRGAHPRHGRTEGSCARGHHSSRGRNEERSGGRGRGGHPPHLKGKAIGLYYRDKQKNKHDHKENVGFKLDPVVLESIEEIFGRAKPPYAPRLGRGDTSDASSGIDARYTHIGDSQFKRRFLEIVSGNIQQNLTRALTMGSKLRRRPNIDEELIQEHKQRRSSNGYKDMMNFRLKLPVYEKKKELLDLVKENQVVVVSGQTGCGKTTQIPQYILDDAIEHGNGSVTKVVCTQPRRISAISVAERVAAERAESLGKSVGYQIRLEKIPSRDYGSILFCTTGLLLQYMQGDPALRDFSHVVLDEIHERNTESDFIISLLKQIIPKRPDLKIILMSATVNAESFSTYYNKCPELHIAQQIYPVMDYYLEDVLELTRFRFAMQEPRVTKKLRNLQSQVNEFDDYIRPAIRLMEKQKRYPKYVTDELRNPASEVLSLDLIKTVAEYICDKRGPGAILIFLPGMMDITKLTQLLLESGQFPPYKFVIYPLHSRMPTVEQKLIFQRPPEGIRKIIIATSIAESSITIDDVCYVIDCGRTKLTRFDITKNIETLEPEWITDANATQRRGRAGRVQDGECYHLYTRVRRKNFERYPPPEMLRTPLEQVILQAKILQLGKVETFLSSVMDPPDPRAIELSLNLLRTLNAVDVNEHLTPLGYHLAKLPLDPRTGKMIIWASLFSCVEPVFAIAASLTFKDAFYCPLGKEDEANKKKMELGLGQFSDHIALAEALERYETSFANRSARRFCNDHFLSWNTLKLLSDMKRQFARHLYEMNFLDSDDPRDSRANRNSNNLAMIKAIVCAGLYPNVAKIMNRGRGYKKINTAEDGSVKIHPSSINARARTFPTEYLTYFLKQRSTAVYLHDTTSISPVALLFAAPKCSIEPGEKSCNIVLNGSISIRCETKTAGLIQRLRQELETLLEYKIAHPGTVNWDSQEGHLLRAIAELVSQGYPEMSDGIYRDFHQSSDFDSG